MALVLSGCTTVEPVPTAITSSPSATETAIETTEVIEVAIPDDPENSDHGYRQLDPDRIPSFRKCETFEGWWRRGAVAVSFAARDVLGLDGIEVSTQIYLKNQDLDDDFDGVICLTDQQLATVAEQSSQQAEANGVDSTDASSGGNDSLSQGMTDGETSQVDDEAFPTGPAIELITSNPVSPSPVEMCKIPDGRPGYLQGYPRGATVNGEQVAGGVGFPFTVGRFPIKGEANIILAMVSFEDTDEFVERPDQFLGPQSRKITQWSNFWSQGQFRYNFQIVENWVRIPMKSSEATSNDEVLAKQILEQFPPGIDYSSVDGTFIYWAPGLVADDHDFGIRVGSNENPFVVGEKRPGLFWAPSKWHTETTNGNLTLDLKMRYTWAHLIHEFLHEQGLNMHAPGNGWQTGLGQNQYPDPGKGFFSAALPAWELFIMGWLRDKQIHCLTDKDLVSEQQAVLTPLEISGGDRKALVIETAQSDEFLVVESRRPVGYSEWKSAERGIFVYRADPTIIYQDDHSSGDCGNDPRFPKWSYYLFPDSAGVDPSSWCGDFRIALVREGEKVTYNGIEISLAKSSDNGDVVLVKKVGGLVDQFSLPDHPIDDSPQAQTAEQPWLRTESRQSHCYCCGCTP
ncbi:hypothetical protein N9K78_01815 [Aquiluna sp.]|nr:hypothetical protein [Aquiluna sp.]